MPVVFSLPEPEVFFNFLGYSFMSFKVHQITKSRQFFAFYPFLPLLLLGIMTNGGN